MKWPTRKPAPPQDPAKPSSLFVPNGGYIAALDEVQAAGGEVSTIDTVRQKPGQQAGWRLGLWWPQGAPGLKTDALPQPVAKNAPTASQGAANSGLAAGQTRKGHL
jgi:hypothetical protein